MPRDLDKEPLKRDQVYARVGTEVAIVGNMILEAFSPECLDFLNAKSLTKPIVAGEVLHEPDSPLQNLIFPQDGLVSLQCMLENDRSAEMVSVGAEGAVGIEYLLGADRLPGRAVTVVSGHATWLPVIDFAEALQVYPCVRPVLQSHVNMRMKQLMRSVACASVHTANQRLATWLLHADDRAQRDTFDLTQQVLAGILGVRLATVSECCGNLNRLGAIKYSRGKLSILERPQLENEACECYEASRLIIGVAP